MENKEREREKEMKRFFLSRLCAKGCCRNASETRWEDKETHDSDASLEEERRDEFTSSSELVMLSSSRNGRFRGREKFLPTYIDTF